MKNRLAFMPFFVRECALGLACALVCAAQPPSARQQQQRPARYRTYSDDFGSTRIAAIEGSARAQYWLALRYARGWGAPLDEEKAAQWFLKAAAQGLPEAQYATGLRYACGAGMAQDAARSQEWLLKAATGGLAEARLLLGMQRYATDPAQAAQWFEQAARGGLAQGQFMFGVMTRDGYPGAPANPAAAWAWLELAAENGHEAAAAFRDALALPPGGLARARDLLRDIRPTVAPPAAED